MPRKTTFHLPSAAGREALAELGRVAWDDLDHAYGRGKVGSALHGDVEAALRRLGDLNRDVVEEGLDALWSNICHQGTIYEATAHAVPFLAALAAGPELPPRIRRAVVGLLGSITLASSFETRDGTSAGSFGEGVAELTVEALRASEQHLAAVGASPALSGLARAILVVARADPPQRDDLDHVLELIDALEEAADEPEERWALADSGEPRRFRHPKLGVGTLVREEPKGLRLRFEDGAERLILASFLTEIDETEAS